MYPIITGSNRFSQPYD